MQEDSEQIPTVDYEDYLNVKFSNVQENLEINSLTFSYSNMKEKMLNFYKENKQFIEEPILVGNVPKKLEKKVNIFNNYVQFLLKYSSINYIFKYSYYISFLIK